MGERQLDSNQSRGKLSCLTAENSEVQWAGQAANTKDKIKTSFLWISLYKNPDEITAPADFPPLITWASVSGDSGIALALRKDEGKLLQPFLCAHGPGWSIVGLPEGSVPSLFCCSCTSAPDIAACYQLQVGLGNWTNAVLCFLPLIRNQPGTRAGMGTVQIIPAIYLAAFSTRGTDSVPCHVDTILSFLHFYHFVEALIPLQKGNLVVSPLILLSFLPAFLPSYFTTFPVN